MGKDTGGGESGNEDEKGKGLEVGDRDGSIDGGKWDDVCWDCEGMVGDTGVGCGDCDVEGDDGVDGGGVEASVDIVEFEER